MTHTQDTKSVESEDSREGERRVQISPNWPSKRHKDLTCNKDRQWDTKETNEA